MSSQTAAGRIPQASPRLLARAAGVLYLLIIIGAVMAPFGIAPSGLVTSGAASPTPAKILASKPMYVLGGVIELAVYVCDVVVAFILYELLKPVSRGLALL